MIFLYVFLGLVAFIVLLFSINIDIIIDYSESFSLEIKYLFIKYKVYPQKDKKKKEPKRKKEPEKKKKEVKKEEPKEKRNIFKQFYENQGFNATLQLIKEAAKYLGGTLGRIYRAILIKEMFINLTIGSGDAAKTAIDYGKTCASVFPALGFICSNMRVRKYNIDVSPDFLANRNTAEFHLRLGVRPIKITNAAVIVAVQLLFKVLLKIYKGSRPTEKDNKTEKNSEEKPEAKKIMKGGKISE